MIAVSAFSIIGLLYFTFRLWLDEVKLRNELDFRRRYLSRITNYFFAIAMIYNFESMVFNMILSTSMIALWVAFFRWDFRFYKRFLYGGEIASIPVETRSQKVWMIIERLTLHPPILIIGTIPFFTGLRAFSLGNVASGDLGVQILSMIFGLVLYFGAFFFLDKRWADHYQWPTAKIMLYGIIASCLIIFPIVLVPTIIEVW
ncbi:MAG: hypothetical protein ACTSYI_03685 [Promethearchaeota archaeon]